MTAAQLSLREQFISALTSHDYKLLGEVIAWDMPFNLRVKNRDIQQALLVSGVADPGQEVKLARELLPRFAFGRAAKHMSDDRIIRPLEETKTTLAFQFTKEYLDGQTFQYSMETILYLDRETGAITVSDPNAEPLAIRARELLSVALEERTTADVSRIIKRLFDRSADLFALREAGSVYIVPDLHVSFVDKIEVFVRQLGGKLIRLPVPAGSKGDDSFNEAIANGLDSTLSEYEQAIAGFDEDTRTSTIERMLERLETAKFKLETYDSYLSKIDRTVGTARQELEQRAADLKAQARTKLLAAMAAKEAK